ncbi:hypothetical protein LAZ67_12000490 [Cordylochernes scorpioides]|uniref:Mos1 transposase HTH domain-containing protein n=1 Tax=Cordylochernes scorpioides TaxID=51811 RepID=A0ABY6L4I6_9ARAC|nr:hypothetical protein LAZ67_12000490 [Cordylochernes scorpioides]
MDLQLLFGKASEWRFKKLQKARKAPSKVKVMLTVFFDYQGIVHHEFQQQGSTITADSYLGVLRFRSFSYTRVRISNFKMAIFEEQRICIKFCFKLKKSATETYELIKEAFGDATLSRSRTFEWFSCFQKGREKVNDDQHTGRPRSLCCEENKLKIKELIKSYRRIYIKDLSSETGLSVGLCHQIVTKDLDMIWTSSKFVPRILTEEQKEVRMDVCKNMVERTRTDPEWMQKIITGDETWVYQ